MEFSITMGTTARTTLDITSGNPLGITSRISSRTTSGIILEITLRIT